MQPRPNDRMLERTLLFVALSIGILLLHSYVTAKFRPPKPVAAKPPLQDRAEAKPDADKPAKPAEGEAEKAPEKEQQPPAAEAEPAVAEAAPELPEKLISIGSADPASPYRLLVTLTSRGAAVVRTELNSPRYRDVDDRSGYLGHVAFDTGLRGEGCPVEVVGKGTPAEEAGLHVGDLITSIDGRGVTGYRSLIKALAPTRPGQTVAIGYVREGKQQTADAVLRRPPMAVTRPEGDDPLSFLLTLHQVDQEKLADLDKSRFASIRADKGQPIVPRDGAIGAELDGVALRQSNWEVVSSTIEEAVFRRVLPRFGLEAIKTYRLVKVEPGAADQADYRAYHLELEVSLRNIGQSERQIAYQLDGPTGLPVEGAWYANKVGPGWGLYGLRDVLISQNAKTPNVIRCTKIAEDDWGVEIKNEEDELTYIGVDAQYFSSVLIPKKLPGQTGSWFSRAHAIRVGDVKKDLAKTTNTSCRLVSVPRTLKPGEGISHAYEIFAGPKRPPLLRQYGLGESVFYGWFWWVAIPMQHILHFFEGYIAFNYGLAIILLTVLVRSSMFPLSKKQALGARKMQELQPEIKKISEKYKKDPEALRHAQQELFRKHNYNPLSGCLPVFLQLPIFIGLYRALMVDVELRGAALLGPSIRWCSNLAAPDMLFDWSGFWASIGWGWFNSGQGMLSLGPYFNILPLVTIALFIVQQKMFMPPPADDQAKIQQNMMSFMMIFMGLIFFKVASGLCIYFIASSLWGVAERKLLPKHEKDQGAGQASPPSAPALPRREGFPPPGLSGKRKKNRGRR
jgi:YidC/Oxa1 family membrane protein insertase